MIFPFKVISFLTLDTQTLNKQLLRLKFILKFYCDMLNDYIFKLINIKSGKFILKLNTVLAIVESSKTLYYFSSAAPTKKCKEGTHVSCVPSSVPGT